MKIPANRGLDNSLSMIHGQNPIKSSSYGQIIIRLLTPRPHPLQRSGTLLRCATWLRLRKSAGMFCTMDQVRFAVLLTAPSSHLIHRM